MTVRILLADDHVVVRQGLRALLEAQPEFRVVAEACDGIETLSMIREFQPDVSVVDIMMPGLNGLEVIREVHNQTRVVVLSMHSDRSYVCEALRGGAFGFVSKDASSHELIAAIRAACRNEYYLSRPFSDQPLDAFFQTPSSQAQQPYEKLTQRERQILQLIVEGNRTDAIARRLKISPRTVELHRSHIMEKYGVHTQIELVRQAIKLGLISL
jgi:two-component system response regulator NreC